MRTPIKNTPDETQYKKAWDETPEDEDQKMAIMVPFPVVPNMAARNEARKQAEDAKKRDDEVDALQGPDGPGVKHPRRKASAP